MGISILLATFECHIISKQHAGRYIVNNVKPLCYNNPSKPEALLSPRSSSTHVICIIQFAVIDESIKLHTECSTGASTR